MTPEQAADTSAEMFRSHVKAMNAITERGTRECHEWSATCLRICDRVQESGQVIAGMIHAERDAVRSESGQPIKEQV